MKSIFDKSTRDVLINRIAQLSENSKAEWGMMNVFQMMKHVTLWDEMILRNKKFKRPLIGILLGWIFLKNELKDDRPMRHNNPTVPEIKISEANGDIENAKANWISSLNKFGNYALPDYSFVHPFFGKMTRDQIGFYAYKHTDHHLRQFGV